MRNARKSLAQCCHLRIRKLADPRALQALTRDRKWALFLDVDGTLVDIKAHPGDVFADRELQRLIEDLAMVHSFAVALISGRSLSQLDRIFGGLQIPAAGSHGHEVRLPDGSIENHSAKIPASSVAALDVYARERDGLHLERKPHSIALHYRAVPHLAADVINTIEKIQSSLGDDFSVIHGKMVVELMPAFADKGTAVQHFMTMEPFAGRLPVFIGDDVTDEAGFDAVNELGGRSIRIGAGTASAAKWQLPDVASLHGWLRRSLENN